VAPWRENRPHHCERRTKGAYGALIFFWWRDMLFLMKRVVVFLFAFLSVFFPVAADGEEASDNEILVRFIPFALSNVNPADGKLIESLILSYISDIDGISVYVEPEFPVEEADLPAPPEEDAPDTVTNIPLPPDYSVRLTKNDAAPQFILTGSIALENERYTLSLNLDNLESRENIRQTAFYKNISEMALNVRAIIENYFQKNTKPELEEVGNALPITVADITGTWQGTGGIELLRFMQGGRAIAYFSSGAQMELQWTIEDKRVSVTQTSPNNFRYYYPLPSAAAEKLAAQAEPMQWKMYLYKNSRVLRGICVSTSAETNENSEIEYIIYGNIKKTEWIKMSY
jgi:hypothetical protein